MQQRQSKQLPETRLSQIQWLLCNADLCWRACLGALLGSSRSPQLPEVPSMCAAGYGEFWEGSEFMAVTKEKQLVWKWSRELLLWGENWSSLLFLVETF